MRNYVLLKPKTIDRCIFCGRPGTTKEHMFSAWTHRYMGPREPGRDAASRGYTFIDRKETRDVRLPGQIRDWQVKCVWGGEQKPNCNNGWMRELENRARPILIPLIQGHPTRVSPEHQAIIAAWASLKTIVSECDLGAPPLTHHMQRKRLMKLQLPPARNWAVWIAGYERREWKPEWISSPFLVLDDKRFLAGPDVTPTHYNGNISTQVIGKLFIHVVHGPMRSFVKKWRFTTPDGGTIFRIWPEASFSVAWPGRMLTDRDADAAASEINNFIRDRVRQRIRAWPDK